MCGICGIFDRFGRQKHWVADETVIGNMTDTLGHRGPDWKGVHVDGPVALGNTRLAIIDLSQAGQQPMILADGDYVISLNGEIYNYLEIRKELEAQGLNFRSNSDTEVLLRLYMTRGRDCLQDLRGMFAFAIWDRPRKHLFLARDRAGEKPLVYTEHNGGFCFGSEIKSLLSLPGMPRKLDPEGLHFGFHHVNVPAPYSAFKNIRKLRPAECFLINERRILRQIYWQPRFRSAQRISDPKEAVFELNRCLDETVKIMSRSDVPIGATLSGGLDSSAVVAALCHNGIGIDTFCVSHGQQASDPEMAPARQVAQHLNTRHHELTFRADKLTTVQDVVRSFDEPMTTFVPLHAHRLADMIRRHVKVALTGNGGDELFGGYPDHQSLLRMDRKMRLWAQVESYCPRSVLEAIPLNWLQQSRDKFESLRQIPLSRIAATIRIQRIQSFFNDIYSPHMKSLAADCDVHRLWADQFEACQATSLLDGFLMQQLLVGSQHSIVDIPDISGMASALEYRSPFLDVHMMELAMRLPTKLKIRNRRGSVTDKWIMRRALKDRLPLNIINKQKAGFGSAIPYHRWALNEWSPYITKKLKSKALADSGLFDMHKLQGAYQAACMGARVPLDLIWGVAMTAEWLEAYMNHNQGTRIE